MTPARRWARAAGRMLLATAVGLASGAVVVALVAWFVSTLLAPHWLAWVIGVPGAAINGAASAWLAAVRTLDGLEGREQRKRASTASGAQRKPGGANAGADAAVPVATTQDHRHQ